MDNEEVVDGKSVRKSGLKVLIILLLLTIFSFLWLATSTTPGAGGPLAILFFLLLVFLISSLLMAIALQAIAPKIAGKQLSPVRLLYTSVALGSGAVFLVGLQTLRQLTIIDVVLIAMFEVLLNFYLLRRF